jgi:ankyrin repeat protein
MLHGRYPQVQDILRGHPGLVNQAITSDGGTAVHFAIRHANGNSGTEKECLELLDLLSDLPGVNWNARDRWKRTPLHVACASTRGYGQVADFLLYHRANPNLLDDDDSSPLHDAVTDGQKIMVGILLKSQLINAGFPSGTDQRTALHKAAYRGHLEIAAMLLDHDAEVVHMKDAEGHTPLHDASRQNRPETALMLIEADADVNAKTKTGATPLHLAAANNAVEVVKVLLRADAWPFSINNNKETPEMVAERKGHTAILDLLRLPFDIDSSLAGGGQALQVTPPTEPQKTASKDFTGFIWPSIDGHSKYDKASVFDMLYADEPKLKKSRKDKDVRWIHVPSNNVRLDVNVLLPGDRFANTGLVMLLSQLGSK